MIDLTSSEPEVQSEGHESEDAGVESAGDVLDSESDSDNELLSVLNIEAFDDQVEFEFECRICRRRRWCTLCRDHRFRHRFCLLCERCLDVDL